MLTKPEFVSILAERCELSKKEATEMYEDVFGVLTDIISEGNEIAIPGLGRVKITERSGRTGVNPRTGEEIEIPAKKSPKFQFSKNVKSAVADL